LVAVSLPAILDEAEAGAEIGPLVTGAAAGAIADVMGSFAAGIAVLAAGADVVAGAAGGVIVTGAREVNCAVASTLCAMAGAEERARIAAIAVEPRRSGVVFLFIVECNLPTCPSAP
jgi:hypothetical protein